MKIVLTGNPYSNNNIYFSSPKKLGLRFMNKKAKEMKKCYKEQAENQWCADAFNCELQIAIKLFFGDKRKRDWDNYHKLSMDALTGIVWEDDSQIKLATVSTHYDKENPRIELEVAPVDNFI
jgi:crossover junction endodeoxyribonuclease RusA